MPPRSIACLVLVFSACADGNEGDGDATAATSESDAGETDGAEGGDAASDGEPSPRLACDRYLECVAAVDPAGVADAVAGYGPDGSCWTPSTGDLCTQACIDARRMLWNAFPQAEECADCGGDDHCDGATPVCAVGRGLCVACATDDHCPADAPGCDADTGACVACSSDAHCRDPQAPACTEHHECAECRDDSHCGGMACDQQGNVCVCTSSSQCQPTTCFEGSCGHEPLLPLEVGRAWTYELQQVGTGNESCPPGLVTASVSAGSRHPEGTSVMFQSFCIGDPTELIGVGDDVLSRDLQSGGWSPILDEPVANGHQWVHTAVGIDYEWRFEPGPIDVPAGVFENCWTRIDSTYGVGSTYCRGVGKIYEVSLTYIARLVSWR